MPRFRPLHPRNSLRRLRTAFGPTSAVSSPASVSSRSPLSASSRTSSKWSEFNFDFDFDNTSTISLTYDRHTRRIIRSKKSMMEIEQEEERNIFANELVALVEPRPQMGLDGIEEILEGRI